jgi:hypothetical protein
MNLMNRFVGVAVFFLFVGVSYPPAAGAQSTGGSPDTAIQKKLNPLAAADEVPVTFGMGVGGGAENLPTSSLDIQPRVPLPLNGDWRVIVRPEFALLHFSGPAEPTGLSDLTVETFLTPKKATPWVWGVGPIVQLPTATNSSTFGTGKWSAGPTAALLYVAGPWVNGIVVSHLSSVAGPSPRDDVSETEFETQVSYAFPNSPWYVETAPTIAYDWRAPVGQRWVVPVGVEVGRELNIAHQDMSVQVGSYYGVARPDDSPKWAIGLQFSWVH